MQLMNKTEIDIPKSVQSEKRDKEKTEADVK